MPTTCAVYHCPSPRGLTYHVFPSNPVQASRWAGNWTKRKVINFRNARICSNHFKESDYKRDLRNELLGLPLRKIFVDAKNVVPSLNLNPVDDDSGGESEDGYELTTKGEKETPNKAFKRKSLAKNDRDSPRTTKVSKVKEEVFEIFEYSPDINEMTGSSGDGDASVGLTKIKEERLRSPSSSSTSDPDWSDADLDYEHSHQSYGDPYVLIQRLKEKLVQKNKRIAHLKKKLKSEKTIQLVYVQNVPPHGKGTKPPPLEGSEEDC